MIRFASIPFWTAAGGLQLHDTGVAASTFIGDIIIRGGRWNIEVYNASLTANDIKVRAFLFTTVPTPNFAFEPVTAPILWDPTASPDFIDKIGKPYKTMEVIIESGHSWSFGGTIKLQKIDQVTYGGEGKVPIVSLLVSNVGHTVAAPFTVTRFTTCHFLVMLFNVTCLHE